MKYENPNCKSEMTFEECELVILRHEKNRRIIHPDPKLKQLLNVNNDELTYFNLQKYLKFHFKKDVAAAVAKA
jgi:hypothetical protein